MRPKERRNSGQNDLYRARLDQSVNLQHELAKLVKKIDWAFLEETIGSVYTDAPGQPPLPTRLMAGQAILKHIYNLRRSLVRELNQGSLLSVVLRRRDLSS